MNNMGIITKNIKKVKGNQVKDKFIDTFGFFPQGSLTMIYAGANTGKSLFMIAMGKEIANSKKEISYYHFDGDGTLITAADRGVHIIEDKFPNFRYLVVTDKKKQERFEYLKQFAECDANELRNALIVIDSIKDFFIGDMIRDKDVSDFMEILKIITSKGGTIVMLHHQTKQTGEINNKAWKGSTAFNDSADNTYYMSSIKKNGYMIANFEVIKKRADIQNQTFIIYEKSYKIKKPNKDEVALELLGDKERYTIEIAKEIIEERVKITQGELVIAINSKAESLGLDVVGNNKKIKLLEKFNHKFWRIDDTQSAIRKIFYPILSENFKQAQDKKEHYLQKLIDLKAQGKLPISLGKFGSFLWPHLNAKEVEKLLIDDIILDSKGQLIIDVISEVLQ